MVSGNNIAGLAFEVWFGSVPSTPPSPHPLGGVTAANLLCREASNEEEGGHQKVWWPKSLLKGRVLHRKGAAHNLNNRIAIGALIYVN
jgi:hypothetical protein